MMRFLPYYIKRKLSDVRRALVPLCKAQLPQQEETTESAPTLKIKWIRSRLPQQGKVITQTL